MNKAVRYGIDTLLRDHADWIEGRRVGLVAHAASVDAEGVSSAQRLRASGANLVCLFGPEHGYSGRGGAGEAIGHVRHPEWDIPVYSLYGKPRRPDRRMLAGLDTIVFDLQDLGARCYTYVSTLRYVLEAAVEHGKAVVVCDRPAPLAHVVDGPMLDPAFESFVGAIRAPLVYGMTPGETARWIRQTRLPDLDLRVAAAEGYTRGAVRNDAWPAWVPPSPAIRSWEAGSCFAITVFFEALPCVDHGRGTATPFQLLGAPWLKGGELAGRLNACGLAGLRFEPCSYKAGAGPHKGRKVEGVRIVVTDASEMRPVRAGVTIIEALQEVHGAGWLWAQAGTREGFFDQLMGTDTVRRALHDGVPAADLAAVWEQPSAPFLAAREKCLLYR